MNAFDDSRNPPGVGFGLAGYPQRHAFERGWNIGTPVPTPSALDGLLALGALALYEQNKLFDPPPGHALAGYRPIPQRETRKRVFISFQSEDLWAVKFVRAIAASDAVDFDIYDESLKKPFDSTDATYIRQGIRHRIWRSSVTICLVGATTHESKWVDWELKESLDKGNWIIGMVVPDGPTHVRAPRLFRQLGAPVHLWNLGLLKSEIAKAEAPVAYR